MRRSIALLGVLTLMLVGCGNDEGLVVGDDDILTTTTTEPPAPLDPDDEGGGEDEGDDAIDPDADRPAYTGGYDVDYETGEVDVSAYDAFVSEHGAPSGGLEAAALEMLGDRYDEVTPEVTSARADGGRTMVTVTFDGLRDDSVRAERYQLVFIGSGDDVILESGSWASICQEGRGHQEYSTGLCI